MDKYATPYKNRANNAYPDSVYKSAFEKKKDAIRSSSCFSKIKQNEPCRNELAMKNHEKIDHIDKEINKFHSKITELESQKRKMNIDFTPFEFRPSPARRVATEHTPDHGKKTRNVPSFGQDLNRQQFFNEIPSRMSVDTSNERGSMVGSRH
jgi:hypothetical protein